MCPHATTHLSCKHSAFVHETAIRLALLSVFSPFTLAETRCLGSKKCGKIKVYPINLGSAMSPSSLENLHGILFDHGRGARIGLPEAVFSEGKDRDALLTLLKERAEGKPILFTRLSPAFFESLPTDLQQKYDYHPLSRTAFSAKLPRQPSGSVVVVSAGTSDGPVTWEAARTLDYFGIPCRVFEDCGVAGLWRLTERLDAISAADVIIVVAGMDGALASVLGSLSGKPMFAVPTSTGYGRANHGETALSAMLASCAQGIAVLNIDNGFGAACAAARILHLLSQKGKRHEST